MYGSFSPGVMTILQEIHSVSNPLEHHPRACLGGGGGGGNFLDFPWGTTVGCIQTRSPGHMDHHGTSGHITAFVPADSGQIFLSPAFSMLPFILVAYSLWVAGSDVSLNRVHQVQWEVGFMTEYKKKLSVASGCLNAAVVGQT